MDKSHEIDCPGCRKLTLLKREPVYEGFTRVGDALSCLSCGHAFESEDAVPFKGRAKVEIFTDADRSASVDILTADGPAPVCRRCQFYVVNPFVQRCEHHKRFVEATDTCSDFRAAADEAPDEE